MNDFFAKLKYKDKETVFVRHATMVEAGSNSDTLSKTKLRLKKRTNKNSWIIDDPEDGRRNLYNFDTMPEKYRELVEQWLLEHTKGVYSDPYEYMALEPIRLSIKKDDQAEMWFMDYSYELNGQIQKLSMNHVAESVKRAGVMNMLLHYSNKKRECKKHFGLSWMDFVAQVGQVVKADRCGLPSTYRGLILERLARYTDVPDEGYKYNYAAVLPKGLGGQNAAKIREDDLSKDMMLTLLEHPLQYTDKDIEQSYNRWAKEQGLAEVTSATVANKRREYEFEIKSSREGWQEHNKKFNRSVQRFTPTQPLYCIEGDDNHIDWWFVTNENKIVHFVVYVVVDSFKGMEYPLGWAFSDGAVTVETVRVAHLMAANHIKELTGGYYLPHELKTDNWQTKTLIPFYESLGNFAKSALGSKNRGWLENFFGSADWKRSLKANPAGYPCTNYTGHNISSKTMGVSQEHLQQMFKEKQLPNVAEADQWITAHFERLRMMPYKTEKAANQPVGYDGKKSRQQLWLENWSLLPESRKRPISEEMFLIKYGLRHEVNGGNTITKSGVQPTISGAQYTYAVPPAFYLANVGRKVVTVYDPFNMNRVLITDDNRLRFVAHHVTPVAGCMADMGEGGRSFLNQILAEKKADVEKISQAKKGRRERLLGAEVDSEAVLKLGVVATKEIKQPAEGQWLIDQVTYSNQDVEEVDIEQDSWAGL